VAAATHRLFDVDPYAITLCKKGANRQTILLRKSAPEHEPERHVATAPKPILKTAGDDWRAFYIIVADPSAEEDGGQGADGIVDVWKSDEEIRAAAHRFLKNNAYVNAVHDGPALDGCNVVESAVALNGIKVGEHTIPEGAWYVGIEPDDAMREAIDAGDVTGVSIEGTGMREAIAKASYDGAKKCPGCSGKVATDAGKCQNCGHSFSVKKVTHEKTIGSKGNGLFGMKGEQLPAYIQHVYNDLVESGKPTGGKTYKLAVGIVQNWAAGHDGKGGKVSVDTQKKAAAAIAEWEKLKAKAKADNVKKSGLRQMWERVMPGEPVPDELRKETLDFNGRVATATLRDESWRAWDTLQAVIYDALSGDDTPDDPQAFIRDSIQQFSDYLLSRIDGVPADTKADVKKALGLPLLEAAGTLPSDPTEEDVDTNERIEKIEKAVSEQSDATSKLIDLVEKLTTQVTEQKTEPTDVKKTAATVEDVKKALDEATSKLTDFAGKLDTIEASVDALAEGAGSDHGDTDVRKTADRPLAGLFD
jgi:hypothetical protein